MSILCQCIEIIVKRGKASAASSVQHLLQHVPLTLSQVSKINRQSIQNFVKNDGFEYGVKSRKETLGISGTDFLQTGCHVPSL